MNPPIVARSLVSLMITALLLLSGCEGMMSIESNPPAVVPNPQPGAPIPGGLRIVSAHATPLSPDMHIWKPGMVNVRFNGAATTEGVVEVSALSAAVGTSIGLSDLLGLFPGKQTFRCRSKLMFNLRLAGLSTSRLVKSH